MPHWSSSRGDLAADPGETRNLAARYPAKVREMEALLHKIRQAGRSRPSAPR